MYGLGVGKVARDGSSQVWQSWIGLGSARQSDIDTMETPGLHTSRGKQDGGTLYHIYLNKSKILNIGIIVVGAIVQ